MGVSSGYRTPQFERHNGGLISLWPDSLRARVWFRAIFYFGIFDVRPQPVQVLTWLLD